MAQDQQATTDLDKGMDEVTDSGKTKLEELQDADVINRGIGDLILGKSARSALHGVGMAVLNTVIAAGYSKVDGITYLQSLITEFTRGYPDRDTDGQ